MKKLLSALSLTLIITAVSCSSVFYGNVSGKLVDADTKAGIENATVYLYTDKSARDSAFDTCKSSGIAPESGFYASDITDANGSFNINKVYWKTTSPEFGKTADTSEMYLLFYKEGYGENGFAVNRNKVTVISESSGSEINEELERKYNVTNISLTVGNILTENAINEPITTSMAKDETRSDVTITKINDSSYKIIAAKDLDDPVVTVTWDFRDKSAKYIITDEEGNNLTDKRTTETIFYDRGNITLYAKPTEFEYPEISGQLKIASAGDPASADGIKVELLKGERVLASAITENSAAIRDDNTKHGTFTLRADSTERWTCISYEGKYTPDKGESVTLRFTDSSNNIYTETVAFSSSDISGGIKVIPVWDRTAEVTP